MLPHMCIGEPHEEFWSFVSAHGHRLAQLGGSSDLMVRSSTLVSPMVGRVMVSGYADFFARVGEVVLVPMEDKHVK